MTNLFRAVAVWAMAMALSAVGPAAAQENLDAGKSGAQLYASDCLICHKSAQSFAKGLSGGGLEGFLRKHYTASRESAAAITAYLRDVGNGKSTAKPPATSNRKTRAKAALPPRRPVEPKSSSGSKPSAPKASDVTQPEKKQPDEKQPEKKPAAAKDQSSVGERAEAKAPAPKPAEREPADSKPTAAKPAPDKIEAKPDKPASETKPEKAD
jgi:hypothetical protein